jgi:putative aldouronate transport system permease protein
MSSVTEENSLIVNGYSFFPKKISLEAYRYIFENGSSIFKAYGITISVTVIGTGINLLLSSMLGYALSIKNLPGKKFFGFYVFFTMLFNGGLVPSYLMYSGTFHIKNTFFALLVPNLMMSAINVLLMRTFFVTSIPDALYEAAEIDGAGKFTVFSKIVIPLGKPIIVTMGMFSALAYWNDWTNGLYYITDASKYGIQNVLNKIITDAQFLTSNSFTSSTGAALLVPTVSVRMAIAFVAMLPILMLFPFMEKYFRSGITIGAVKG